MGRMAIGPFIAAAAPVLSACLALNVYEAYIEG